MDWSTLIPTVTGGLLAAGSGLAAQYLTHRFTRRREAEKFLREKAEDLLTALDQYPDWVIASQRTGHNTPPPTTRAFMLQKLYFPGLAPHFSAMQQTVLPVEQLRLQLSAQPADLIRVGLQPLSEEARRTASVEMTKLLQSYLKAVESIAEAILAMPQWQTGSLHKPSS